ncbi:MAG: hypothetical protein ACREFC_02890, partial [Stellaceae bacterium]
VYVALQRGMADGVLFPWTAMEVFKIPEVAPYHLDMTLGGTPGVVFMAKKKYLALPAAPRKILDEASGEQASRTIGQTFDQQASEIRGKLKADPRQTIVDFTPAQNAAWRKRTEAAIGDWTRETPNGPALLAKYRALLAKLEPARGEKGER